jgi:predicted transcriptional regulator
MLRYKSSMNMPRQRIVSAAISPTEFERLDRLASASGLTRSALLRRALNAEVQRLERQVSRELRP